MTNFLNDYLGRVKAAFPEFRAFGDGDQRLVEQERDYKLELCDIFQRTLAERLRHFPTDTAEQTTVGRDVIGLFTRKLSNGEAQNLVSWRYSAPLAKLDDSEQASFAQLTAALLYGTGEVYERIDRFVPRLHALLRNREVPSWPAMSRSVTTFLLMLSDPSKHVIVKTREFKRALNAFNGTVLPNRPLSGEDYRMIQQFLFKLRDDMANAQLSPRDLIDVQTLIWVGDRTYGNPPEHPNPDGDEDESSAPSVATGALDEDLPVEPHTAIWIEDTKSEHHHGGPGWEFGICLWSPSANETGADSYALMREPAAGDLVIHIYDSVFTGWSHVARKYSEISSSPPLAGAWGGRKLYYRIDLTGYQKFNRPVSLAEFVDKNRAALEAELRTDQPSRYPFILYQGQVRHAQGVYLGKCTKRLYELIRRAVEPTREGVTGNRYWAMSLGEGGRLWDDCQEKGIAAIGWDEYELGDLLSYPDRDSILEVLLKKRAGPGPAPTNDALCLYQFSHEIRQGDYIVAKAGRLRILGIGRVTSDYIFDEDRSEYQHTRQVKWLSASSLELPKELSLATKTLTDITAYTDLLSVIKDHFFQYEPDAPPKRLKPYGLDDALSTVFVSREQMVEILAALNRKKNVILQGPPGVGKTFVARHIAYAHLGELDDSRIELVQFHQSYSYEDFVQGWRPKAEGASG
jgi:hypothetical protein